jgi:hypothetical protein
MLPSTFLEMIDFPLWLLPVISPPFNVQCQISWGEASVVSKELPFKMDTILGGTIH